MSIQNEYKKEYIEKKYEIDPELLSDSFQFRSQFLGFLRDLFSYYEQYYYPEWIEIYKEYFLDKLGRRKELIKREEERRTNVKYPLIKMIIDTLFSNFYDTKVAYKVYPREKTDVDKAKVVQDVFNWVMDISNGTQQIYKAVKEAFLLGTGIFKIAIKKDIEEGKYLKGIEKGKKIYGTYKRKKYYPTLLYVDIFNILVDPSATSFDDARYVVQRKILPIKEAINNYKNVLGINLNEKQINTIINVPYYISEKDYSKIKKIGGLQNLTRDELLNFDYNNLYQIWYQKNDLIEVIEYYEKGKMIVMFNGYIVYDDITIYPFSGFPFEKINYTIDVGGFYGKGIGNNNLDLQKIADTIFNAYLDQVKVSVAPMFEVDRGTVYEEDVGTGKLKYVPYKVIHKRSDGKGITPINLVSNTNIMGPNAIQLIQQIIEYSEGPNQYTMGGGPVERSATGASLKANITKQRLKPIADSVSRALSNISEKILILLTTIYPKQLSIRVLDEKGRYIFKDINPQDIIGQYDIVFEPNSMTEISKEIDRAQLIQFISQVLPAAQDPVRQRPLIDMEELFKTLVSKFNLPDTVILNDEKFKQIISNLQTAQYDIQQKVNQEIQKKEAKNKGNENITPELLAKIAGENIPKQPVQQNPNEAAKKEQDRELKRELYSLYGKEGLAALLQKYKNPLGY